MVLVAFAMGSASDGGTLVRSRASLASCKRRITTHHHTHIARMSGQREYRYTGAHEQAHIGVSHLRSYSRAERDTELRSPRRPTTSENDNHDHQTSHPDEIRVSPGPAATV
jgi:hypothetical protein